MDKDTVNKLAKLSRIELKDDEAERLAGELGTILTYVSDLKGVISGNQGATNNPENFPTRNVMREDGNPHESGVYTETLLNSAPDREDDYIKVKKIL